MAETLISPGVLTNEKDQSFISSSPLERGAAIIGPTVNGPIEKPTLVSSYSSYRAIFGGELESGSQEYSYFTSIAANDYFQKGGKSLLVTRVVSASSTWTPATSTLIQNRVEASTGGLIGSSFLIPTTQGSGSTGPATYTNVPLQTITGSGSGALVTVRTTDILGNLISGVTLPLGSGGSGLSNATYTNVALSSSFSGNGTGAQATVVVSSGTVDSITVTTIGNNYQLGDLLTIAGSDLGGDGTYTLGALVQSNILTRLSSVTVTEDGSGYAALDTVGILPSDIGSPAVGVTMSLLNQNIENNPAFTLETISEGSVMNNTFPVNSDTAATELANGSLISGSKDNIRWEIASVNTSSGVFSLLIRRGDDSNDKKIILETFKNISLDPFSTNYISRAIGDITTTLITEGSDTFLQESGSSPNISNYVRVKSVDAPTPNYFDNDGTARAKFTSSLPLVGSGSFDGAGGSNIPTDRAANFYQNINSTDTQGLLGQDYNNAIALLLNKDDYQYNVISAPGLSVQNNNTQITSIINNSISRGDNIAVIDLVGYNQQLNTVINLSLGIDSSYASTYWPWLQTVDPNNGQLVFIPSSTFIPSIYAFNDASSNPWFAPAGKIRGKLGQVIRAERKLTSTNRDTLYKANVNPILTLPNGNVLVFGQKTLQKAASALDRVNVRRLLIALKDFIKQIADNLVFEQNTISTRNNFLTQVNPYLEGVKQKLGLFDYKIVMDETNNTPDVIDRNELVGQIFLKPTKTAEFIILDFNILPTGVSFP